MKTGTGMKVDRYGHLQPLTVIEWAEMPKRKAGKPQPKESWLSKLKNKIKRYAK